MSQLGLFPVTDQLITRPCNSRIILSGLRSTKKPSQIYVERGLSGNASAGS